MFNINLEKARCAGAMTALQPLAANTKPWILRSHVGRDYNNMISRIQEAYPSYKDTLPPKADAEFNSGNESLMPTTATEMYLYYSQLFNILVEIDRLESITQS